METQNTYIVTPEGFNKAELIELYQSRIKYLESIVVAAKSRGDIDEILKTKEEINKVLDAINALT